MKKPATLSIFIACLLTLGLSACSSIKKTLPDRKVDYKKEVIGGEDLEIPPDLTRPSPTDTLVVPELGLGDTATYSQYAAERSDRPRGSVGGDVLPEMEDIEVRRDGDKRWLVIQADPDQVWPKVVSFWRENGILLVQEDPTVGVMETGWLENRADIKKDFITDAVRSVFDGLYTAATRDQYRVRLEEGQESGTTELYLTQRGMQQKITATGDTERPVWEPRPNDPELEAEMLRRIMVYLGVADKRAQLALASGAQLEPRSQLIKDKDGRAALLIDEDFSRAWRITGVALDRVGFVVEDRDRSLATYYVRYRDPTETREEGLLSKLAFWSREKPAPEVEYRITLIAEGAKTRVRVLDAQGQPDSSGTATRILTLLQEQIR